MLTKREKIIPTTKTHSYKQFLASVIYNSEETPQEIKEDLYEKYGDIIKIND